MAAEIIEDVVRVPMPWEEYLQLGDTVRGEYIDGCLVVTPTPSRTHQNICHRLAGMLEKQAAPGMHVITGWGWRPPKLERGEFVPDVMVYPNTDDEVRFAGLPYLAVEVLSTNRVDDLVIKATKYAHHGLRDYWIIDPAAGKVTTFELREDTYAITGEHSHGTADLMFAGISIAVDLDVLFA